MDAAVVVDGRLADDSWNPRDRLEGHCREIGRVRVPMKGGVEIGAGVASERHPGQAEPARGGGGCLDRSNVRGRQPWVDAHAVLDGVTQLHEACPPGGAGRIQGVLLTIASSLLLVSVVQATSPVAAELPILPPSSRDYKIGPDDIVQISVLGHEDLTSDTAGTGRRDVQLPSHRRGRGERPDAPRARRRDRRTPREGIHSGPAGICCDHRVPLQDRAGHG